MAKIRNSLSAKVFLWVLAALTFCSLLIYGIVMIIIPRQYTIYSNDKINGNIDQLSCELEDLEAWEAQEKIADFCRKNHACAILKTGTDSISFGDFTSISETEDGFTVSMVLQFSDAPVSSFLTIAATKTTSSELNATFLSLLPIIFLVILLVSVISAWLCSRVIVRPILKISHISKRMAQMDMTWRCEEGHSDELGILAQSLNQMSDKLTEAMEQLEETNRQLAQANGKLEQANEQLEQANGQLRQEIATVNAIEKQRRDFFAAASHELKTPLTILKGQIESMILEIGKYKDVKRILPETLHEVEEMEQLVKEILSIARLEMNGLSKQPEDVNVQECLQTAVEQLMPLAREKHMVVHTNMQRVTVWGHALWFQKALHNVVSNAIRHSPRECEVEISLTPEKLTVINTGVTLPEEEISDLFTPFYRVEKSRNKKTGGSGLGLYLVKTILSLHQLPFSIANGEDCVIFTIFFEN